MELQNASITYGEASTASLINTEDNLYYQADRIKNRIVLDFGVVDKNKRAGMELQANGIKTSCLLKSIHAPSKNSTDDGLVWEVHDKVDTGVKARYSLQFLDRNNSPFAYPELVLMPENVIFVTPGQDSRVLMVIEPINLITTATNLIS